MNRKVQRFGSHFLLRKLCGKLWNISATFPFGTFGGLITEPLRRPSLTHLTQIGEAVLLRYPPHRLRLACDLDRPVVGVKRRLAEPEQRSQPKRLQQHRAEGQVSSGHLRKVLV